MMSSTADNGEFPPNPFQSGGTTAPPPQQQQQQQQQQQLNQFYGEPPQPPPPPASTTNGGPWMQPQPDNFTIDDTTPVAVAPGPMDTKMSSTQQPVQQPQAPLSWWQRVARCCSLDTYKVYFDIDTLDVVTRIKSSIQTCHVPDKFRTEIVGVERNDHVKGPDLYGPFWIILTLVFLLAVTSNLHAYLHSTTEENFEYDISHLVRAMTVLFTFGFGLPSVLWLLTQCMGMHTTLLGLMDWICLYGYSMVVYLPTTLLCLIPYDPIEWLVLAMATAVSCLLILRNVAAPLLSADGVAQTKAAPIMLFVLGSHVIFLLVLKFVFYHHHKK